nr:putative coat protein [Ipomoea batatas]
MRNECATLNSSGVRYWDLQLKEATEKAMECVHDAFKEGCHLYFIWSGFIASILTTTLKSNATLLKLGLFFLLVLGGTLKGEEGEEPIEEAGRLRSRLKKPVGSVVGWVQPFRKIDALAISIGFAFAIQQIRDVNVTDTLNETLYIPCFCNDGHSFSIPDDQLNHWNPNTYIEAVECARTLGLRFHIVDMNKKDGRMWWLFHQHFAKGNFELQCPLPKVSFTKAIVVTHAQFLNGELANPSRAFVNLAPFGNDSFGVVMSNHHLSIHLSCYEAIIQEANHVVSNL